MVDLHSPGFTTSPSTTISREMLPIPAVLPTRRDSPGLDVYTQSGVSHHPSFTHDMSMLTKPIPPSETTAPGAHSGHQVQLPPYPDDMGPPHTPLPINQPGSYSRLPPQRFPKSPTSYYPPTPHIQTTPSYHPSPYRQELTLDGRNSYVAQSSLDGQSPSRLSFGSHTSYDYSPSEVYGTSEKTNILQNTFNTISQRSNVHHNVFSSSVQRADEFQNPPTNNEAQMHLSNTSNLFQDYNSNGKTENPAANSISTFTTGDANKGYARPF